MATPRRYLDKNYMRKIAPDIYGGAFRKDPSMIGRHAEAMFGARGVGYVYQLLAMVGWTSLPWLRACGSRPSSSWGATILWCPSPTATFWRASFPIARLEVIDDGHLFIVTQPVETARRIERFLEGEP